MGRNGPSSFAGRDGLFLADAGRVVAGMLLGAVIGIVILALRGRYLAAIPVLLVAGLGVHVAGNAGAALAAGQTGCVVRGDLKDAGEAPLLGLAIGALPTMLIVGGVAAIWWLPRPRA